MPAFQSDRRLCLNGDKSAVVDCDGPDAAFVLAGEGGTVSAEDAERYGLTPPAPAASAPATPENEREPETDAKRRRPAEDKAVRGPAGEKG